MTRLTSKQRAELRRLAHSLKPTVLVGGDGVTDPVAQSVREAFNTRELIKIKALDSAPSTIREIADTLTEGLDDAHTVQTIGRTAVLYRPDPDEPVLLR
ncbi:MAG: YhbY family RNA-binding protein [Gemmatimonadota bacterium]|nr:YhbY family RNA-binding protein [Gemmatimonadota bacterium]